MSCEGFSATTIYLVSQTHYLHSWSAAYFKKSTESKITHILNIGWHKIGPILMTYLTDSLAVVRRRSIVAHPWLSPSMTKEDYANLESVVC